MTRRLAFAVAVLLAVPLLAVCTGEEGTPPLPPPPTTPAEATATASPIPTATASPTPTATPSATATSAPSETAEARPNDERVASTANAPFEELGVVTFTNSSAFAFALPLEVPPRSEYTIGLSGRYWLGERGMLFHYSEDRQGPFWMKNTHIDLAIAFIDSEFRIVEIREMVAESEELITPASPYRYAVEAPSGWYAERGIGAGDEVRFLFELPDE